MFLGLSWWDTSHYVTTTFFQVLKTAILNNIRNTSFINVLTSYRNTIQLLCVFGRHFWITFLGYVCITYWNNVTVTFCFRLLLRRNFFTSKLSYLFTQMVSFYDDVRIKLNYGNCWNVWILYGSYVVKWSYFSYIIF